MTEPTDDELETLRTAVAMVTCDVRGDREGLLALWDGSDNTRDLALALVALGRAAMDHLATHLSVSTEDALGVLTQGLLP